MRRTTALMAQWQADMQSGETLHFELCRGGYFSDREEYGLRAVGKTVQEGSPTAESPIEIRCVKAGTEIICGNRITVPRDLYEGDIWYPASGKLELWNEAYTFTGDEKWYSYTYQSKKGVYCDILKESYTRTSGRCTHEGNIDTDVSLIGKKSFIWFGVTGTVMFWVGILGVLGLGTPADFKAWVQAQADNGTPLGIVYRRKTAKTVQCEPQRLWAPEGDATVTQVGGGCKADMAAVMMKRG